MESVNASDRIESRAARRLPHVNRQPRVHLLVADDDENLRSLVAARAGDVSNPLLVLEAADGADAIQIGLQRSPEIALLDVNMPRLGGIEVAITLRELRPQMRLALYTADPLAHRARAGECRLPLFGKLELDRIFEWLETQAHSFVEPRPQQPGPTLECYACGYGIASTLRPARCPMCQREDTWIHSSWQPVSADRRIA